LPRSTGFAPVRNGKDEESPSMMLNLKSITVASLAAIGGALAALTFAPEAAPTRSP
jgi:hypothetical protein